MKAISKNNTNQRSKTPIEIKSHGNIGSSNLKDPKENIRNIKISYADLKDKKRIKALNNKPSVSPEKQYPSSYINKLDENSAQENILNESKGINITNQSNINSKDTNEKNQSNVYYFFTFTPKKNAIQVGKPLQKKSNHHHDRQPSAPVISQSSTQRNNNVGSHQFKLMMNNDNILNNENENMHDYSYNENIELLDSPILMKTYENPDIIVSKEVDQIIKEKDLMKNIRSSTDIYKKTYDPTKKPTRELKSNESPSKNIITRKSNRSEVSEKKILNYKNLVEELNLNNANIQKDTEKKQAQPKTTKLTLNNNLISKRQIISDASTKNKSKHSLDKEVNSNVNKSSYQLNATKMTTISNKDKLLDATKNNKGQKQNENLGTKTPPNICIKIDISPNRVNNKNVIITTSLNNIQKSTEQTESKIKGDRKIGQSKPIDNITSQYIQEAIKEDFKVESYLGNIKARESYLSSTGREFQGNILNDSLNQDDHADNHNTGEQPIENIMKNPSVELEDIITQLKTSDNIQKFVLDSSNCNKTIDDETLRKLLESITRHIMLNELSLDLGNINDITDIGLKDFSSAITELTCLYSMQLNLQGNTHISDEGLEFLADAIAKLKYLTTINLNFSNLNYLTDFGIKSLSNAILFKENYISRLDLTLSSIKQITNDGLKDISQAILRLRRLRNLYLDFSKNESIDDYGLIQLSNALSKHTTILTLELNFSNCNISDFGLTKLSNAISTLFLLNSLRLNLQKEKHTNTNIITNNNDMKISDDGMEELAQAILRTISIYELYLNFSYSNNITDTTMKMLKLVISQKSTLNQVELLFDGCGQSNIGDDILKQLNRKSNN